MLRVFLVLLSVPVIVALSENFASRRLLPNLDPLPLTEHEKQPRISPGLAQLPPLNTTYYFDQLIDHSDPKKGTFKQRYWFDWEWYRVSGPIVLATPGEDDAEPFAGYVTNRSMIGQIAQQERGASIILEHRFFGESNPYPDLTVDSLRVLTLQQNIDDLEYFANNVVLAMPGGDAVAPGKTPWVIVGGSYSGALAAWAMVKKPDLFQAGYATSAVVEIIIDFWQYFDIIRQYMPANCSADVQAVVAYLDDITTNTTALDDFKANFGLQDLEHVDDVANALTLPLGEWQSLRPTTGPNATFYQFCDALEVKDGVNADADGWGLEHAIQGWGKWFKESYLPEFCGNESYNDCLGTYDATSEVYTNTSVGNAERAWFWMVCNEFGWFQDAPPKGHPAIVSRTLQPSNRELRQCQLYFPEAFPAPPSTSQILDTNQEYQGWDLDVQTIFFANGKIDPWRDATVSADGFVPPHIPADHIGVHDSGHVADLVSANGIDPTVFAVQKQGLAFVKRALTSWRPGGNSTAGNAQ